MKVEDLVLVIPIVIIWWSAGFLVFTGQTGGFWFNPKENYARWNTLNWFGVWFLTICYWIAFLPITIIVAVSTAVKWIFTVGRK